MFGSPTLILSLWLKLYAPIKLFHIGLSGKQLTELQLKFILVPDTNTRCQCQQKN